MTWTAVGSELTATGATFTFAPSAIGNIAFMVVVSESATVSATGITSTNATWAQVTAPVKGTHAVYYATAFKGVATSASSATATIAFSGTVPTVRGGGFVFHSSVGSYGTPVATLIDISGTAWPVSGVAGLYFGYAYNDDTQAATTTSGFTSAIDGNGNPYAYDLSATAATAPTFPDTANQLGYVIGIAETIPTITSTGSFHLPGFGAAGSASEPAPITSTGSFHLPAFGVTGSTGVPTVTSTGSFALPAFGVLGSAGPPVIMGGGTQGVSGTGTIGWNGPVDIGSGSMSGGALGVTGSALFSSNTSGPGGSGDGGNPGGTNPGFDAIEAPNWFAILGDLDARVEFLIGESWVDLSSRVLIGDTITLGRGHPDESTTAAASTFTGTLDNHDGWLSYLNPHSPYYGLLGALNTPLRVSVPDASPHLRLENDSVSYANYPAISKLGSFEIWLDADADNWYRDQTLVSQWDDTTNQCGWFLSTVANGALELGISQDGVSGNARYALSFPLPVSHGRISVRVTYDSTSGQVIFYQGKQCQDWVATAYNSLPVGGPKVTAASVELGYATNAAQKALPGFNGKVYAFALLDTLGGTVADNSRAVTDFTALTPGVTTWGDGWTMHGTGEISDRFYRFHGESGAWPQTWTPGDPNARIGLSAGGLLRRMGASDVNINSAMYRAYTKVSNAGVEAYWPFEDGSNATQLASALGGSPFRWYGATPSLGSFSDFACSAPIVSFNGASLVGTVPSYAATDAAVVRFLLNIPTGGDTSGTLATIYYTGSRLSTVNVGYTTGGLLGLSGWDASGTQLFATSAIGFGADGELLRMSVEVTQTGSGVYTANLVTLVPGASSGDQVPVTGLTGSVGSVSKIVFNPDGKLQSASVGHVSVESVWTSLFELGAALAAYQNELAGVRFQRLCADEGILFRGIGNILDTVPMGPQAIESLPTLLQECVDADQGAWLEPRQVLGWGYRTRASLGNQYASVGFDYNQDQLSDALEPTVDDQVVKNDITVSSQNGSSSRQVLDDGSARSVGKIGRYDTTFTVNVADDQLDSQAGWRLHALTVNEPRYKQIGVDLANRGLGDLYWDILSADLGDRITVQNPPVWLPPGLIDQLAQGANEIIGLKQFSVQWTGVPSTPWNVAYMDDVVFGRADTDGSVLVSDVTATATTLSVANSTGATPLWVTDEAEFPFDIGIAGERLTVTAVTGTTSPQAFTVIRSVNGVSKGQVSGADVRLFIPSIISL